MQQLHSPLFHKCVTFVVFGSTAQNESLTQIVRQVGLSINTIFEKTSGLYSFT